MKRIWRRSVLSGLLAALALGLAPVPAHAAVPSGPATFGVRPATAQAPDNRPNFSYSATPGAVVKDYVAVSNVSNDPLGLKLYANDAFNTPEGGFDLLAQGKASVDVGTWAKLDLAEVRIPGRTTTIVPFTVTIPANATPGDHVGGIVAALVTEATNADGQRVAVEQRVGARIYLRVSGDLVPKLSIDELTADYDGTFFGTGDTTVSYTVRNVGNVRLGGKQKVTVETPWGSGTDAPNLPDLPELLPGNSFRVTTVVPGVLPAGWLDGLVRIDPVPAPGPQPQAEVAEASVTIVAVPWLVLLILLLVVALVLFLLWRRRRRRRAATTTEPDPLPEVEHATV
ncbi:DUF916 domain-containing protein [Actinokineospora sp. NBRC 105648]|uniref:WxL protein peptidoglycan domain-containing protein n=1 Tax=Actinokineospora sp. NBRC 105648 TaxID=3032206 RepID=UPI0024A2A64E|nr:DUF916 domain-containing protein [Actinokineospora sp. NBRC 105648]GLZ40998.1 hypothetical protein Acsp05_46220 [Actinokineospora sp. NBRC 105648]